MKVVLVLLLVVLEYAAFAGAFAYSTRACNEDLIKIVFITCLSLPPIAYFMADRRITRGHLASVFIRTVVATFIAMIPIAIAVPSMINAPQRSRQKVTLVRMREVSQAFDSFAAKNGRYPKARNVVDLQRVLPVGLPVIDGWCTPFAIVADGVSYEIISLGRDRKPDRLRRNGGTSNFDDDLVLRDGTFTQYPEGFQTR